MRYFDTSFLVPLILPEATSEPISGFLEGLPDNDLAISHWIRVEFASLLVTDISLWVHRPCSAVSPRLTNLKANAQ